MSKVVLLYILQLWKFEWRNKLLGMFSLRSNDLSKKDKFLAILARKFKVFEKYLVAFSVCMFGGKEGACTGWLPADFIQNQSAIKDVNYGNGNGDMT